MTITSLTIDQYDDLLALWDRCGLPYEQNGRDSREQILRQIADDHVFFLVLRDDDGTMIGSAIGTYDGRRGWINRVAIDPAHRGKRLAALLVKHAEDLLAATGARIFGAMVLDTNEASQAAFRRMGYEPWRHVLYFRKQLKF